MTQNPSPTINGLLELLSHYQISLGRKNTNGEISVFIADRKRPLYAKTTCSFKNPSDRITVVTMGKFQVDWTCLKGAGIGQGKRAKSRGDTEDLALRSAGLDRPCVTIGWARQAQGLIQFTFHGGHMESQLRNSPTLFIHGQLESIQAVTMGSCHFTKKFHRFIKLSKQSVDPDPQRSQPASWIGPLR
ncbi:hypothetical protein NE237_007125 [Protea cynaroides]|uniref:Uncharacterized protein n=1 Tax=Protea cynaroides TaxID=273540 RepID=A0A9Q0KPE6_9MAGN|nr:hypothetical protein NE237_007125 [Protea cynaroides]